MEIHTTSAQETQTLGEKIATDLIKKGSGDKATILTLSGELGSGKTTFVQGFARGLGLLHRILSPTFILVREYPIHKGNFKKFYHIDLYRLESKKDLEGLGISEIFNNSSHIVVIEWAERLKRAPKPRIDFSFSQIFDEERLIKIKEIM